MSTKNARAFDGEVLAGVAVVDESGIAGESVPLICASGGDRSAATQPRRHNEPDLNHARIDVRRVNPGF